MSTLVCFHAHPDDEAITTGGVMAKAKADGHRVVLVVATRGEHGEVAQEFLQPGEQLGLRRIAETLRSAELLGADRVEFLGYVDSGMIGTETNDGPYSFWTADVDAAAGRLAAILGEEQERSDRVVLTIYDDNGGYGHPDHIQVHRVGVRAARIAGVSEVYEGTMNIDAIRASIAAARTELPSEMAADLPDFEDGDAEFGKPESVITHAIDVSEFVGLKRASMRAHPSQISEDDFFLAMPDEMFARSFGTEWFIRRGSTRLDGEAFGDSLFA